MRLYFDQKLWLVRLLCRLFDTLALVELAVIG